MARVRRLLSVLVPLLVASPALAQITVDTSALTTPPGQMTVRLDCPSVYDNVFQGALKATLPDGTYTLTDYSGVGVFGTLQVSGGAATSASGGLAVIGPQSVGIDRSHLSSVLIDPTPLSTNHGDVVVRPGDLSGGAQGPVTYAFPPGTWALTDYAGEHVFGSLTVQGTAVVATSGAVITVPNGVGFDLTRLASVNIHASALTSPPGHQLVRIPNLTGGTRKDAIYYLPPGTYTATSYTGNGTYGTFTVAGTQVSATTGAITTTADGIAFDNAALATVTLPATNLSSPPSLQVMRLSDLGDGDFSDTVFHLPDATYTVTTYGGEATYGSLVVAGGQLMSASGGLIVTPAGDLGIDPCQLTRLQVMTASSFYGAISDATTYLPSGATISLTLPNGSYSFFDANDTSAFVATFTLASGLASEQVAPSNPVTLSELPCMMAGMPDAGTAGPDAGDLDAGVPPEDAGLADIDAGSSPADDAGPADTIDAGTPEVDAGTPPVEDAGAMEMVDAGTPVVDAGAPPEEDAGVQAMDAGSPSVVDAGPVEMVDAGAPAIDAGAVAMSDAGHGTAATLDAGPAPEAARAGNSGCNSGGAGGPGVWLLLGSLRLLKWRRWTADR